MPWLDKVWSWVLVGLVIATIPGFALALRFLRYAIKRIGLAVLLYRHGARPRRPLWWLIPWRSACDCLLPLRDPATGQVTHTLAIQLIPTVLGGTEYCIGDMVRWQRQRTVLFPMARGVMPMNLGYRRLRPRSPERIFRRVPEGAVRVYLFHPHPWALTLSMGRQGGRHQSYHGPAGITVPLWQKGILLLDLETLRKLLRGDPAARAWLHEKE